MRKKAIFAVGLFCLIFLIGGVYIVAKVETSTSALDSLIKLHQVELRREHLLMEVRNIQLALKSKNRIFSSGSSGMIHFFRHMESSLQKCFQCHHDVQADAILRDLMEHMYRYETAIKKVLAVKGDEARLAREGDAAFSAGSDLQDKLHEVIIFTAENLRKKSQYVLATTRTTKNIVYWLLALGPVLAIGLAILFMKSFAQPLRILLDATHRLKRGDLDYRLAGLKDEFEEVGQSFNEMSQSLKDQISRIQRAEQLAVCGELAAGLGHEIRNPLSAIRFSLQLLAEEQGIPSEDRDVLEKIGKELNRVETLVKGLLDYARLPKPERMRVNVNQTVESAVMFATQYHLAAGDSGDSVKVTTELSVDVPMILADTKQLLQILLNLIINAIEAMPEGGMISVRTSSQGGDVQIEVQDTGPGVPSEIKDKIFEPFFTNKGKGTGLGLAITRRLIEQHGGSVGFSNRPGGGACFSIRLPVVQEERSVLHAV